MLGLDYSSGPPSGAAVVTDGYGFVARYLENGLGERVNLSAAELADMRAHGVAVAVVWESGADRATEGYDAGVADARAADAALNELGLTGYPCYFVVDFDVPDHAPDSTDPRAKLGSVDTYFDGVVSVLGLSRTGVYGGFYAVSRCLDAGVAAFAWQTAAWSGDEVDSRAHLYQHVGEVVVDGVACDVNESRHQNFGQQAVTTAAPSGGSTMAVFLKNLDTNDTATQDGPLVNGVDPTTEQATLKAWPGACCEIGLNTQEWNDRVRKSQVVENLGNDIAGLMAAVNALPEAIAAALAKAAPVNTGGVSLDALTVAVTTAVTTGVKTALAEGSRT